MKWRNSKERELLSSGGCREQTLPTKMNPNPDLSDVGTGKKSCEDDLSEAFRGESSPHQTYCHSHHTQHQMFNCMESNVMSPSDSSKHSDFSDSEDEEITVS